MGAARHPGWAQRYAWCARIMGCLVAIWITAGCVSTVDKDARSPELDMHPPLIVTRSEDVTVLHCSTRIGQYYTILYTDGHRMGGEWNPLPGAVRIPGNGDQLRVEDRVPHGYPRRYRLMIEAADGRQTATERR